MKNAFENHGEHFFKNWNSASLPSYTYRGRGSGWGGWGDPLKNHHSDVIMSTMASQIIAVSIVCQSACSGANQRKQQSSASLAFMKGIHHWPVNSPRKGPATRKMFPLNDVIMAIILSCIKTHRQKNLVSKKTVTSSLHVGSRIRSIPTYLLLIFTIR